MPFAKGNTPKKNGRKTKSQRAGLLFPVAKIERKMRAGGYASRLSTDASVYLTSAMEYLMAEILELSGNACILDKRLRILDKYISGI